MTKPSRRPSHDRPRPAGRPAAGAGAAFPPTDRVVGTRAGRRERARPYARRSFFERYRGPIVTAAIIAVVGIIGAFTFQAASAKTYVCTTIWDPAISAASPAPGESARLGIVQPDMGRQHVVSSPQGYTYCPPASGSHHNRLGQGPIDPKAYGPDDFAEPGGWIHNLEHGAMVLLYRCREGDPGCQEAAQTQVRDIVAGFPNSPVCNVAPDRIGPVAARFDEMAWPYAAIVWGRVLPLQTLDKNLVYRFFLQEGERTNPEPQCLAPSASPGPSASPSVSAAPSGSPSPSPSGSPAASGSASPSASPAASPSPSAS